ncbi:putative phosphoribosyl transferase [Planobispora rosea]|uniref:Phosphoribosyltransferase domain-containing protein n=1 Tax=Planobispora rosea TaxID=35762 RepID=A0A8J3S097_PLARO|nr:phosphoribosyltransferase [Planobispora rosea]GGS63337.1 putative phosphoribosyl transferase [Planobispora rosea]GIH84449.1 hypothetical protein Pro02_28570 [Planobispora rosea]
MFTDRTEAGRRLAVRLGHLRGQDDVVVLGLPRGGVPIAFEVARELGAPLDVILVRKLGVPVQPELGFGAIGEDGVRVVDPGVVRMAGLRPEEMARVEEHEREVLAQRAERFREGRPGVPLAGRTAVVVDDGIATGSTARAACRVARAHGAARVVLAAPVCAPDVEARLGHDADEIVCLVAPGSLGAIGQWYEDFTQVDDKEVVDLLNRAGSEPVGSREAPAETGTEAGEAWEVRIPIGETTLSGTLTVPVGAPGVVVFVHGSGSSRHSPRNRYVAEVLNDAGLGTLLFDLLTPEEEGDRANVFDISLLAGRLERVTGWLREHLSVPRIGYFGASTGAAAALWAAAGQGGGGTGGDTDAGMRSGGGTGGGGGIAAVVSRGGRPDLAGPRLAEVSAPTLLIVGGWDEQVLELNEAAQERLRCENRLEVVPGATHLFEEPGTLETAAALARDWFARHLRGDG